MAGELTDPKRFGPHPDDWIDGAVTIQQASGSGAGAARTIIAAQGAGAIVYLTGMSFSNTGEEDVVITLACGSKSFSFIVPTNGGNNPPLQLKGEANTAWTVTPSREVDSVYCQVSGFVAT